jgi:hypothetical protein
VGAAAEAMVEHLWRDDETSEGQSERAGESFNGISWPGKAAVVAGVARYGKAARFMRPCVQVRSGHSGVRAGFAYGCSGDKRGATTMTWMD